MIEQKKENKSIILFFVLNVPNLTANNQVEQFSGVKMVSFLFLSKHYNTTALLANHLHPWEETKGQSLAWKVPPFESYILMDQPLNSLMNIIDKGIISGNWNRKKKDEWTNQSTNQYLGRKRSRWRILGCLTDLEDPLVDDDDGDVEAPPLEDGEHRADGGGVPHLAVLHGRGVKDWLGRNQTKPAAPPYVYQRSLVLTR